jgi:hypothetical protein
MSRLSKASKSVAAIAGIAAVSVFAVTAASAATPATDPSTTRGAVHSQSRVGGPEQFGNWEAAPGMHAYLLKDYTPFTLTNMRWNDEDGPGFKYTSNEQIDVGNNSGWWVNGVDTFYHVSYDFTDAHGLHTVMINGDIGDDEWGLTGYNTHSHASYSISNNGDGLYELTYDGEGDFTLQPTRDVSYDATNTDAKNALASSLSSLCGGPNASNGAATCTFVPNALPTTTYGVAPKDGKEAPNSEEVFGCYPWTSPGVPAPSEQVVVTTSGDTSVTNSLSDSLTESVNVSIEGIVDLGLSNSTTWGKSFTSGHSNGTQVNVGVQYGYQGDPWIVPNIATVSGTFHATIGGINWDFANVDITGTGVANPNNGDAAFGAVMNEHKMTKENFQKQCGTGAAMPTWMN